MGVIYTQSYTKAIGNTDVGQSNVSPRRITLRYAVAKTPMTLRHGKLVAGADTWFSVCVSRSPDLNNLGDGDRHACPRVTLRVNP